MSLEDFDSEFNLFKYGLLLKILNCQRQKIKQIQPGDQIFMKGYGFLSFAKNIGKDIDKIVSQRKIQQEFS